MSARKRSGALTGLLGVVVLVASGCGSNSPAVSASTLAETIGARHVLDSEAERAAGVRDHPLRVGERALFVFDDDTAPVWTMRGVGYPLMLSALDGEGRRLGSWVMHTCGPLPRVCVDQPFGDGIEAPYWVEERITKKDARKGSK